MTHKQSRRTQRALERALFGPEPKGLRKLKPRVLKPSAEPKATHGACWACGDSCELGHPGDTWTCPFCGAVYIFGSIQAVARPTEE